MKFFDVVDGQADLKVIVREYHVKNDNTRGAEISERFFSPDDPQFLSETTILKKTVKVYDPLNNNCALGNIPCDCDAGEPTTLELNYRTFNFSTNAVNKETPEIEKYVEEAVHKNIHYKDEFTYNILAYVTTNADEVVVTDELNDQLEFVSTASDVKVYDLGTEVENGQEKPVNSNHLPVYDVSGTSVDNGDVTPSVKTGTEITIKNNDYSKVEVDANAKVLTVTLANKLEDDGSGQMVNATDDQELKDLRGHYIRIEFKAKLSEEIQQALDNGDTTISDLEYEEIKSDTEYKDGITGERGTPYTGNDPVKSKEDHTGIPNTASYTIKVIDEAKYQDTSNTVTVKPEKPEIEKFVNEAVHEDIALSKVFKYDIVAYVTNDADKVVIEDTLVSDLEFAPNTEVSVYDLGTTNNHKVKNDIGGSEVNNDATVSGYESKLADTDYKLELNNNSELIVTLDDEVVVDSVTGSISRGKEIVKNLRGHWIRVEFFAQIKQELQDAINNGEKTLADLKNVTINPDELYNAEDSIFTDEDRPLPNVGNYPVDNTTEAHDGIPNTAHYSIDVANQGKYKDESNTVTVKPKETSLKVKKTWDDKDNSSKRPKTITVKLLQDGKELREATLDAEFGWEYEFTGLEADREYTVEEVPVNYYVTEVRGNAEEGFELINHTRPWLPETPGNEFGNFNLTKIITKALANVESDKTYSFRVSMIDKDGRKTYEETVKLKANEQVGYDYVPAGTTVHVEELTTGYKTTYMVEGEESKDCLIEVNTSKTMRITNDIVPTAPDTSDNNKIVFFGMMLLGSLVVLLGVGALKMRTK